MENLEYFCQFSINSKIRKEIVDAKKEDWVK
jgi:hypothetical protein